MWKFYMHNEIYDLIGIGVGPANLGLAALLSPINGTKSIFFDKKKKFTWHDGVLLQNSDLQVHYLKDLVTLIDPTNPHSFLSFLVENKRIFQFLNQNKTTVSRKEYEQYYQWVSLRLDNLKFDCPVRQIDYENSLFKVKLADSYLYAKNISLGIGKQPRIPSSVKEYSSKDVMHSNDFVFYSHLYEKKSVCIIGGGQSAAEIIYEMMNAKTLPHKIYWVNKYYRFLPLEDSCFSNEYYTPSYCMEFYSKDKSTKNHLVKYLNDTNSGITLDLLDKIYHRAYELKFIENSAFELMMLPSQLFHQMHKKDNHYEVILRNQLDMKDSLILADKIIFCTGYKNELPDILSPIFSKLKDFCQTDYNINPDFTLPWLHENSNKIYMQNAAAHCFGLGDTNLGIFAWRNATIINSLLKKNHYKATDSSLLLSNILSGHNHYEQCTKEKSHEYL